MSESTQRRNVVRALKSLDAVPIENRVGAGTPDVNFIDGWIELKWLRRWPKGEDVPSRIKHFNKQQARWLKRRWELGGSAWMLLQVGQEWLLFTGRNAGEYVGKLTRKGLYRVARAHWKNGLVKEELIECLKNHLN